MKAKYILFILVFGSVRGFTQSGINWTPAIDVSTMSMYGNLHPRVVVDNTGDPMVLWGKSGANQVYFSKWNGGNFSTPVVLNQGFPAFTASWAGPDMASYGDTVYIVFKQTPEDTNHIYLVSSFDAGNTFSAPVRVDYIADSNSRFPSVAVDGNGNPLVAFMKFDPVFMNARYVVARSNDFGNSFMTDKLASEYSGGDVCDCCPATLTASGNKVAMIYRDNLSNLREIWAGISTDAGNSFPSGMAVDQTNWMINACPSSGPDGVIIGDTLYSVFMSGAGGNTRCYWSKSSLTGLQTGTSSPLAASTQGLQDQNYPRIANLGNTVVMIWVQMVSGSKELALLFAQDISMGFPMNYDTVDLNGIVNADVAISNGALHVVWEDNNSGTVKYRKGTFQSTLGLAENDNKLFSIYPNPAYGDILYVEGVNTMPAIYEIRNLLGQLLLKGIFESGMPQINVASLSHGFYIFEIETGNSHQTIKFFKQ